MQKLENEKIVQLLGGYNRLVVVEEGVARVYSKVAAADNLLAFERPGSLNLVFTGGDVHAEMLGETLMVYWDGGYCEACKQASALPRMSKHGNRVTSVSPEGYKWLSWAKMESRADYKSPREIALWTRPCEPGWSTSLTVTSVGDESIVDVLTLGEAECAHCFFTAVTD